MVADDNNAPVAVSAAGHYKMRFVLPLVLYVIAAGCHVYWMTHYTGCEYWEERHPHEEKWDMKNPRHAMYENYCEKYVSERTVDLTNVTWSAKQLLDLEPNKIAHIHGIPKIIHQQHSSRTHFPWYFGGMVTHCSELDPDWIHVLWTDDDFESFLGNYYPDFLHAFKKFPKTIQRIDSIRYAILHHFGGVYLDADVHCLRPLNEWMEAFAPKYHIFMEPIHIIATRPKHPLWSIMLNELKRNVDETDFFKSVAGGDLLDTLVRPYSSEVLCDRTETKFRGADGHKYLEMVGVSTWLWKMFKEDDIQHLRTAYVKRILYGCVTTAFIMVPSVRKKMREYALWFQRRLRRKIWASNTLPLKS